MADERATTAFTAGTRLPGDWPADAVEDRLEALRRRWNQFGVVARVRVMSEAAGIAVRYDLRVCGHRDPVAVHAAFRRDLDRALEALVVAAAPPAVWDLEAMAQGAAASAPGRQWAWDADTARLPPAADD